MPLQSGEERSVRLHSEIELRGMKIPAQLPQLVQTDGADRGNIFERESRRLVAARNILVILIEGEPQGLFIPAPKNLGRHGFDGCQDCDCPHCRDWRFVIDPDASACVDPRRTTP